ncbi:MAG: SLC13 family permease, partial [Thermoactinomyces sp.]
MPLVITFIAILLLLVLISYFKINPFVTLLLVAVFVGVAMGMPLPKIADSIKEGVGNTLGLVAIIVTLGTMVGKMMAESGGAERIAQSMIKLFGPKKIHWAMMFTAFIVGLPLFLQVGFVLLIPLLFAIARKTGTNLVKIGIPLVAGLSATHGLIPPHPAPMAVIDVFKANVGLTIFYAIIVALPSAIIAGPIYGNWISKRVQAAPSQELMDQMASKKNDRPLPGLG